MLARSVRYFPLVGLLIALIMSVVLVFFAQFLPTSVAVVLTLVAGILSTGAFHEDGLADVADSAGAFDLDRKLEIMRDSRVGTYGSLGLILGLLLRFVLIWELAQISLGFATGALVLAHASSRWSSAYLLAFVDYARPEADNKAVADGVNSRLFFQATACLLLVLVVPAILISLWIYMALVVVWLATVICAAYFRSAFEGTTGDCLGAANVVIEIVCFTLVLAALQA